MSSLAERARLLIPGLWAGLLACIALVATPAPFALLSSADAGRVVARIFAHEGYISLAFGVIMLALERMRARMLAGQGAGSQFTTGMVLALIALFCTVVGYFALQPLMDGARQGQGSLSFGQLHGVSLGFFAAKSLAVLAMAWRAANPAAAVSRSAFS